MIDETERVKLDRVRAIKAAMNKLKSEIDATESHGLDVAAHVDAARHLFGMNNLHWLLHTIEQGVQR